MKSFAFQNILSNCTLCPRECGVDRVSGQRGFCGGGSETEVFRYAPHFGEEPPISGNCGSGTVFFSRCTLHCLYCQNYPWSQEGAGSKITTDNLADMFRNLRKQGCHNWNLVSPTPWLPMIGAAMEAVKSDGEVLPVVYNTSGYERIETLTVIEDLVDIYLADLRYAFDSTAESCSSAGNYVSIARAALLEMIRQAGQLRIGPGGTAVSGVICRILILPGLANEACLNIRWLAANIGTDIALSVMSQYTPAHKALGTDGWNRAITRQEYRQVCREVEQAGFHNGWIQDFNGNNNPDLVGFNMPATDAALQEMRN